MLQEIKGDPDIFLWNGFVSDWVDIDKLVESSLVRLSFDAYVRGIYFDIMTDQNDPDFKLSEDEIKKLKLKHRKHEWQFNQFVTEDDIERELYNEKRVVIVEPKIKNKNSFDRLGKISY